MEFEPLVFDWWSFFKDTAAIFFLISVAGVFCLMIVEWVFWPFWLEPKFKKWMEGAKKDWNRAYKEDSNGTD